MSIPKSAWQTALTNVITSPEILLEKLNLDKKIYLAPAEKAAKLFGLRVTESFLSRMEKNNPADPLLLQVLPLGLESLAIKNFTPDPLQEKSFNPVPGLLHKYNSRVLITFTGFCAIHCRYCFRRSFPYDKNNAGIKNWDNIFSYIAERPDINEIILSGGDPLSAPDHLLKKFGDRVLEFSQIKILRFHTRLPIVLPERLNAELIHWLESYPLQKVMVLHTNHPNEIDNQIISLIQNLKKANIVLLNQSVLLKKINDTPESLSLLSEKLFAAGVLPYYLHLLDKVNGTAHFEVSEHKAKILVRKLQERLPGYLVPKLVKEVAGKKHKIMLL